MIFLLCVDVYCAVGYTDNTGKVEYFGDEVFVSLRTSSELPIKYDVSDTVTQSGTYAFSAKLKITDDAFDYAKMYLGLRVTDASGTHAYTSRSFNVMHDYVECRGEADIICTGTVETAELFIANSTKNEYTDVYIKDVTAERITGAARTNTAPLTGALYMPDAGFFDTAHLGVTRMRAELDYAAYAGMDFFVYYSSDDALRHIAENTDIRFCFFVARSTSGREVTAMDDLMRDKRYLRINGKAAVLSDGTADSTAFEQNTVFINIGDTVTVKSGIGDHTANALNIKNAYLRAENESSILLIDSWNAPGGLVPSANGDAVDVSRIEALHAVLGKGKTNDIIRSLRVIENTDDVAVTAIPMNATDISGRDGSKGTAEIADEINGTDGITGDHAAMTEYPQATHEKGITADDISDVGDELRVEKKTHSRAEWIISAVFAATAISVMAAVKIISVRKKNGGDNRKK